MDKKRHIRIRGADIKSAARILLVEDEGLIAEDIRNRLMSLGYAVAAVASTGGEAVRSAMNHKPDLVLMDILLKDDMDGIEAAALIRKRLEVPVVYMTAHSDRLTLDRLKKTEPHGILLKPLRDEEIHGVIDMALFRHGMEKKLRESEQRFRTVADFTYDWEYWIDPRNRFIYVSPSCERITGYKAETFMEKPDLLKEIVHPDDRKTFFRHLGTRSRLQRNKTVQFRIVTRQGGIRWIGHACRPVYDAEGRELGIRVNNRDITDQKAAENKIMRLNRTLTMMSRVNEAVAVIRDRGKLFNRVCQIAVRDGQFALAWIGTVEEKTGIVSPAASRGKAKKYADGIEVTSKNTAEGRGPTGRAIRDGKPVVCGDIEKEKAMQPWRDRALQFGLRSSAAFPFMIRDRVIGALNLYSFETEYFNEEEIRLFEELTGSLTFALEHMEEEKRRLKLEEKTRYLATFPEQDPNPIIEVDLTGRVHYVNPSLRQLLPEIQTAGFKHPWFYGWRSILGLFKSGGKNQAVHETTVHGSHYRQLFHFFPEHGMVRVLALDITERRIAEEALRESEERYRAVIETTDTGYVVLDEKGRVADANGNYVRLTGHSSLDEIQGRSVTEWTAPHDRGRNRAEVIQCLKKGSVKNLEIDYLRADGTRVPVEISASVIRTKTGRMIVTLCRDISERKRAEETIELLKHSIDMHTDGAYWTDRDNRFIYVNEAGCKALGYARKELIGKTFSDVNPMATPEVLKRVWNHLRSKGFGSGESLHRRKDGSEFPVEIVTTYLKFGGREYTCGFARDITERKQAERSLRESESRYRNFVEQSAEGFAMVDEQGRVIEWNRAMEEMTGVKGAEVMGAPLWDVQARFAPDRAKTPEMLKLSTHFIQQMLRTGKRPAGRDPVESEYRRADGSAGMLQQTVFPIRTETGFRIGATSRDVTERRRMEEYLLKASSLKLQLIGMGSMDEKLRMITDHAVEVFGADFARIWITEGADLCEKGCVHASVKRGRDVCRNRSRCLHLRASSGRYSGIAGSYRRVPLGCYKIGRVASGKGLGFVTNDVARDPRVHEHEWAKALGLISFAGYRLTSVKGLPVGVLALFRKRAIPSWEEKLIEDLATTASQVIARGEMEDTVRRGEEEQRQFTAQLTSLLSFILELSNTGSPDDLCRSAVGYAMKNIGFDRAGIWFFSKDRKTQIGSFGADVNGNLQDERNLRLPVDYRPVQIILESREPIVFTDQEELRDEKGKTVGWGNHVSAGLWDGEEIIGFIGADNLIRGNPITPEDQKLLGLLAVSVGHLCKLKRAEGQIKADNREKELMLKEINHRVKNNMQVIASLLNLQSRQTKDEATLGMFIESRNRIQSMALVHEMLYGSKDLACIDFGRYIEKLVQWLRVSFGAEKAGIEFVLETESIPLEVDIAVPCGLIIQELVSNALKYAFPRGRKGRSVIRIGLRRLGGGIELTVGDNGAGLPESFDFQKSESLGMNLVRMLGRDQLKGTVQIDRRKGTLFTIRFGIK